MEKLKIIGHRGVRNIETENTVNAIKSSFKHDVDAVEFDVRQTKDGEIVLSHNRNLRSVYGINANVEDITLKQIRKIKSASGDSIPTLQEILDMKPEVPIVLDVKKSADPKKILDIMNLKQNSSIDWMVTTHYVDKAKIFRQARPDLKISIHSFHRPFKAIKEAKRLEANAITIPFYLLNPLIYWRARANHLYVFVYQNYLPFLTNTPWISKLLFTFYPNIAICTDRPDLLKDV